MQEPTKEQIEAILSQLLGAPVTLSSPEGANPSESEQSKRLRASLMEGFKAIEGDRLELIQQGLELRQKGDALAAQLNQVKDELEEVTDSLDYLEFLESELGEALALQEITPAVVLEFVNVAISELGN